MGGGLEELRQVLERAGVTNPSGRRCRRASTRRSGSRTLWPRAPSRSSYGAATAWSSGASTCCRDPTPASRFFPAGTANLFASNLGIPDDISEAVHIGLNGRERKLDLGKMNGEHFAVMAGAGLDARMIRDTDGGPKDRYGRLAYIWAASKNLRVEPFKARVEVNGDLWYKGDASCLLVGNVGALFGGLEAFDSASPEDGLLEVGVTHAESLGQWARTVARTAIGSIGESPFVQATKAERIDVEFDRKVLYELDGGDRKQVKRLKVKVKPAALTVRAPAEDCVSTASHVKETWNLTGDDARQDARVHGSDGAAERRSRSASRRRRTSHSRGLAFAVSLVLVQGLVVVVGLAVALGSAGFRQLLLDTIQASAPGPTSDL